MKETQTFYSIGKFADNGYIDLRNGYSHLTRTGDLLGFNIDITALYTDYNLAKKKKHKLEHIIAYYTNPESLFVLCHKLDEDETSKYYERAYADWWEKVRRKQLKESADILGDIAIC